MPSEVWDKITYPFQSLNGLFALLHFWEWANNFIPRIIMDEITYPYWDWSWSMLIKGSLLMSCILPCQCLVSIDAWHGPTVELNACLHTRLPLLLRCWRLDSRIIYYLIELVKQNLDWYCRQHSKWNATSLHTHTTFLSCWTICALLPGLL